MVYIMTVGKLNTNCYIVTNEAKEAIVIDPGDEARRIAAFIDSKQLKAEAILLTHGHFDHMIGLNELKEILKAPVYIGEKDAKLLENAELNMGIPFGVTVTSEADRVLKDGEAFSLLGKTFRFIETPGHTGGSGCYYVKEDRILFSGDTIFYETFGKTDSPTSDFANLIHSIREKILTLPKDTTIYPGHGPETSVEHERQYNPTRGHRVYEDREP